MRYAAIFILLIALLGGAYWYVQKGAAPAEVMGEPIATATSSQSGVTEVAAVTVIAQDLEIPWDIAFLPEGGMLVTERNAHVIFIAENGQKKEIAVDGVSKNGEGGLLGIVLHPNFPQNHLLYLYMSSA
ncbi:MAG TPA: PQQ-dependent sugar dehydrogenase, partial [Candidatus Paceibacterota bacterium]